MRVPIRKGGKYTFLKPDPHMTSAKFAEYQEEFDRLQNSTQPQAITEMQRLAELGDFSENAAYQMAKARLRGINARIEELQSVLKRAQLIEPMTATDTVQLGSTVTVENKGAQRTYTILGSSETDPAQGIISHHSPIGAALLGKKVGERAVLKRTGGDVVLTVLKIE